MPDCEKVVRVVDDCECGRIEDHKFSLSVCVGVGM